jgi:hypothetical protein
MPPEVHQAATVIKLEQSTLTKGSQSTTTALTRVSLTYGTPDWPKHSLRTAACTLAATGELN